MKFYTNVSRLGDQILLRGYDEDVQVQYREMFNPTLYVPSKSPSKYKTLNNKFVESFRPGLMKETKEFIDNYKGVSGFEIHGNTNFIHQYISDNYIGEIIHDTDLIKTITCDIETATEYGFPNIETANEQILLISLLDNKTKETKVFGTNPYTPKSKNVSYHFYETEKLMLHGFLSHWIKNYPDVITGWNTNFFDIPYIIRRITNVLGASFASKISPWEKITERKVTKRGNEELTYTIHGISMLDYYELYKKYTYTTQESYTLDHIAGVELNEQKLNYSEYGTFREFYSNNWEKFVDYNIRDVELVDKLEDKMKLIELQLTMAYNAKINYEDVFSPVKMWDAIIYNHLRDKDIVISQNTRNHKDIQFEGAYVKSPIIGLHKWVASFDLASLYPHLIMQYNISPETLLEGRETVNVEYLLDQKFDTREIKDRNVSMTANGVCYSKEKRGFLPSLMEEMYNGRSVNKNKMLAIQQEFEHNKGNNNLRKEISRLNNMQMAGKIALNSLYGALGNEYFRYFDLRMAEGITTSGQLSIRWMANKLNVFMNKTLNTKNKDYVIAIDTDSIYLSLEILVEKTCEGKTIEQKIKYMDSICKDIFLPFIDKGYGELYLYMNAFSQKMQMKREVLADRAIWTAKKRYIMNVHNSEGVQYSEPKIKICGLEMVKSSTPRIIRNKLKESIKVILYGDQNKLQKYAEEFREHFNSLLVEDIAFPRSVRGLKQYGSKIGIYSTSTPIHVRGALLFNHYTSSLGLGKKYQPIRDGDKIKFVYLKVPNTIQEDVISFSNELPKELNLHKYVDYDKQFKKVFLDPLQILVQPLGWTVEHKSTLEEFFA